MSGVRSVVVVVFVVVVAAASVPAVANEASSGGASHGEASSGEVLVVDADGGAEFQRVQPAVRAASDGDTVRVRPGTYRESVTVREDVRLVAPRGATLNGSGLSGNRGESGVRIERDAAPVVSGFRIAAFDVGVWAWGTSGEWRVANTTIVGTPGGGVIAVGSSGTWRVSNVTVRDSGAGVEAVMASGNWTVERSVIRNVTEAHGVDAGSSTGDWTLSNVTVMNADFVGVAASHSRGDWRVVESTVRGAVVGLAAVEASGNWSVRRSVFRNVSPSSRYDFWQPPLAEGVGVDASSTNGSWSVSTSRFVDAAETGIDATGAVREGDGTRNWFGNGTTTDGEACTGHVDCSKALTAWPPATNRTTGTTTDQPATNRTASTTLATASAPGDGDDSASTSGFGVVPSVLAILGVVLAVRRRGRP
ncbi:hypothetical protein [Halorubellus sp. PRR65]|uniref:hypothetical protein n=1 Tax=Halorubellus sp. PRR65 TaxID=3098148 RepID=UPI002B263BE4|nr:hypothetical protein [Halorubellus sp. PRR65]